MEDQVRGKSSFGACLLPATGSMHAMMGDDWCCRGTINDATNFSKIKGHAAESLPQSGMLRTGHMDSTSQTINLQKIKRMY
jgi:hypothetical protein